VNDNLRRIAKIVAYSSYFTGYKKVKQYLMQADKMFNKISKNVFFYESFISAIQGDHSCHKQFAGLCIEKKKMA
jgi:hypothetical protein